MLGCIDCREDENLENDFLILNLWGKPLFSYIVDEMLDVDIFDKVILLTNSKYVKYLVKTLFNNRIDVVEEISSQYPMFMVSGRAVFLKSQTIMKVLEEYKEGYVYASVKKKNIEWNNEIENISFLGEYIETYTNVFSISDGTSACKKTYLLNSFESVVVNSKNDFELSVILKKKELNTSILKQTILARIKEKRNILKYKKNQKGICLIGHSQIDNWELKELQGISIRNCGIGGISSREYYEYILKDNILECVEDKYIVMHGTNDIICEDSLDEIYENISKTLNYIRERKINCTIFFVQCIHVNGRLDRNNKEIDQFNGFLRAKLEDVIWIDTSKLDDVFGNLKQEYTIDGLHLSTKGYEKLNEIISKEVL